jgi:Family of unknown function (DUF6884)
MSGYRGAHSVAGLFVYLLPYPLADQFDLLRNCGYCRATAMPTGSRRLLILGCSQRKCPNPEPLPALERYDGPAFRVLRKFLRDSPGEAQLVDILVLSAEFGLLSAHQAIPNYDRRMTPQRASELRTQVLDDLKHILATGNAQRLFISAPKDYLHALAGYEHVIADGLSITISMGTQGRKLSELRDWLYDGRPTIRPQSTSIAPRGSVRLRGVEIALTAEQVLDIARQALAEGRGKPDAYQSWYVEVDGRRVAPKWLVSVVTGLPVSAFVTDEARRVLGHIGIRTITCE